MVVAETMDDGNSGFRTLARYIGVFTPENRVRGADGDVRVVATGTSDKPNDCDDGPST